MSFGDAKAGHCVVFFYCKYNNMEEVEVEWRRSADDETWHGHKPPTTNHHGVGGTQEILSPGAPENVLAEPGPISAHKQPLKPAAPRGSLHTPTPLHTASCQWSMPRIYPVLLLLLFLFGSGRSVYHHRLVITTQRQQRVVVVVQTPDSSWKVEQGWKGQPDITPFGQQRGNRRMCKQLGKWEKQSERYKHSGQKYRYCQCKLDLADLANYF